MDPKIIAVIIGVLGALLGVYLKEYIHSRNEKLKAITILRSNLFLFLDDVQNNEHLGKLMLAGFALDDRHKKSLTTGDDSKYKELVEQINKIEEHAKTEEILTDEDIKNLCEQIRGVSRKEIEIILSELDRRIEEIDHGTSILGRADIDKLDTKMIHRVLQIKRSLIDIFLNIKIVIAGVYEREDIDPVYVKSQVFSGVKDAITACRHVLPLMKMCNDELKS